MSVHSVDGEFGAPIPTEEMQQSWKHIRVLNEEMKAAGAWVFGGALHEPDTATVVLSLRSRMGLSPRVRRMPLLSTQTA